MFSTATVALIVAFASLVSGTWHSRLTYLPRETNCASFESLRDRSLQSLNATEAFCKLYTHKLCTTGMARDPQIRDQFYDLVCTSELNMIPIDSAENREIIQILEFGFDTMIRFRHPH